MAIVGLNPTYSVKFYRDGLYKLVKFNRSWMPRLPADREDRSGGEEESGKFSQAISRAKSTIYQIGVCNDWDWFVNFTIDPAKYDRYDFQPFYKTFTQWLRDYRKKYHCKIEYLLVPELHKDGAWHMHGFMRGIPAEHITPFVSGIHPQKLIDGGFMNWGQYGKKFGFCSLGRLKDPIKAAGYVTKYITKELLDSNNRFGAHLYFASIGLRRAVALGHVYGSYLALDVHLSNHGQFCDTGWVRDVDWTYFLPYLEVTEWLPEPDYGPEEEVYVDVISEPLDQLSLFEIAG